MTNKQLIADLRKLCIGPGFTRSKAAQRPTLKRELGISEPVEMLEAITEFCEQIELKVHRDSVRASLGIDYGDITPLTSRQNAFALDTRRSLDSVRKDTALGIVELAGLISRSSPLNTTRNNIDVTLSGERLHVTIDGSTELSVWPQRHTKKVDFLNIEIFSKDPDISWLVVADIYEDHQDKPSSYGIYYSRIVDGQYYFLKALWVEWSEPLIRILSPITSDAIWLAQVGRRTGFDHSRPIAPINDQTLFSLAGSAPVLRLFRSYDQLKGWTEMASSLGRFSDADLPELNRVNFGVPFDEDNLVIRGGRST